MKKTAILFPGQGSQYIGMGRAFLEADQEAAALMDMAEEQAAGRFSRSGVRPLIIPGELRFPVSASRTQQPDQGHPLPRQTNLKDDLCSPIEMT